MKYYKYIICILVYRNTEDLEECIDSISKNMNDYKIVIVNSHYDEYSKMEFEKKALQNECDFIDVPNRGYGYGNNRGIEYILKKYNFEYIIISNPDVVVEEFNDSVLDDCKNAVIAPLITTISGKSQNPYWIIENRLSEYLLYKGMKCRKKFFLFLALGINKILREMGLSLFINSKKKRKKVYASHGSFCMMPQLLFDKVGLPYDENMFLFAEEAYLAYELKQANIDTYLVKDIKIRHKEDGSVSLAKIDEEDEERKSVIYYYEKTH